MIVVEEGGVRWAGLGNAGDCKCGLGNACVVCMVAERCGSERCGFERAVGNWVASAWSVCAIRSVLHGFDVVARSRACRVCGAEMRRVGVVWAFAQVPVSGGKDCNMLCGDGVCDDVVRSSV